MIEKIRAYIDSFEEITILVDKDIFKEDMKFFLMDDKKVKFETIEYYEEYDFYKYRVRFIPSILLHKDYTIIDNYDHRCILRSGSIIRTPEFDKRFQYDGPLGVEYHPAYSIFRVWTPVAKQVEVELETKNGKKRYPLQYEKNGLWQCTISEDLDRVAYLLYVRVFEEFKCILDPYAISSSANGEKNYVIDKDKLYKIKHAQPKFSGKYTDAIIYEASVRDFTYYLKDASKGTFLGMIENHPTKSKLPTGIQYIASLGVTHLQLLPIFDFGGVDDIKKNSKYNWGYNPEQFFVPCGWYSQNPDDPYSRINELLQLVDECHKNGLRVNMDVVFNHVYKYEEFAFDYLVPGYNYRVGLDGQMSNASFCGNDFASERYMCSKFIRDVLKHYVEVFHMSGFRFDLMGLLDIDTLTSAKEELRKIDDSLMFYGEGWNMNNPLPDEKRPHMFNHYKIPEYAFFNDRFRDFIRGSQFNQKGGFAFSEGLGLFDLYHVLLGSCLDYYKFHNPTQSVNYVECHDNYTFYDYGITFLREDEEKVLDASRLALEIVLISQGIPFIHAGEEFYRTKQGVENSYNTKDAINKIDYARRDRYASLVDTVIDLISIRKEYDVLRLDNAKDIHERSHLLEALIDTHTFSYLLEGDGYYLYIIIKNDKSPCDVHFGEKMIFDGNRRCDIRKENYTLTKPGVYLFKGDKSKWS